MAYNHNTHETPARVEYLLWRLCRAVEKLGKVDPPTYKEYEERSYR